ncbi:hypothetical protein [Spongiactinospora rosea]|nr:hypothetical protein [Spongiactinospora rosea]
MTELTGADQREAREVIELIRLERAGAHPRDRLMRLLRIDQLVFGERHR